MGILDTVAYLNSHPLQKEKSGRHGSPTEEAEAKKQLTQFIQNKNARTQRNPDLAGKTKEALAKPTP